MSGLLSFTKLAFAAPRLTMALGANTMAARAYATKKLFIGNVAWGTTDNELKEFFGQYGELQDAFFPKDDQGRTKGFGFIELEEVEADKIIQEANGVEFNGRELRVDVANAREERPRREFRRREGGSDRPYRPRRDDNFSRGGDRERSFDRGGDRDRSFDRPRRDSNNE